MSIELMMPSNHLILCCPLFLLPSIFPSITVFSNESSVLNRWPKYWSFSFSISPSNECPGLISFRIDWFDLLAVQKTLRSLLQHHNSKASVTLLFSFSVMSSSLWSHGLQHASLPCPSPFPRACSNSWQLSWWCHPTISSSVIPFSSCLQPFPTSGSFPMSQLFAWGVQSVRASASASVLPMNIWSWFPLGLTGLISLQSKGLSRVFSNTTVQKHQFLVHQCLVFFMVQVPHQLCYRIILRKEYSASWLLFSDWVASDSLWPHGLEHASLPCPSPFPGVCSNSCPLNW